MSVPRARPAVALGTEHALMAGAMAAAIGLGILTAVAAFRIDVLVVPALLVAGTLLAVSLSRPIAGVAIGFLLLPLGTMGIVGPSTWLASSAWAGWMFVLALASTRSRAREARMPVLSGWVLLVIASLVIALASASTGDPASIVRSYVTGAMLFYATATFGSSRQGIRWVLAGIAAAGGIVGLMACWQAISGATTTEGFITGTGQLVARADAGFGQPNSLGGFLVILVPFSAAAALLAPRHRALPALALMLAVLGVYLSFSRTALVALLLTPLFFVRLRTALAVVPLVAVLVATTAPDLARERFSTLVEGTGELSTRTDFWRGGVAIWLDDPLLGRGLGSFPDAYAEARLVSKQFLPGSLFQPPPHAHNLPINVLSEQGVVGLVPLLALFAAAARLGAGLRRRAQRVPHVVGAALMASVTAFTGHNQFDVTLLESTGSFMLGLLGLGAAAEQMEDEHA
jgi:O-antigen ligase